MTVFFYPFDKNVRIESENDYIRLSYQTLIGIRGALGNYALIERVVYCFGASRDGADIKIFF